VGTITAAVGGWFEFKSGHLKVLPTLVIIYIYSYEEKYN
jgi:hypothetical protein